MQDKILLNIIQLGLIRLEAAVTINIMAAFLMGMIYFGMYLGMVAMGIMQPLEGKYVLVIILMLSILTFIIKTIYSFISGCKSIVDEMIEANKKLNKKEK